MARAPASSTCQNIMTALSPLPPSQFARRLGTMPPFDADRQLNFTKNPSQHPWTPSQAQRTGLTTKAITRPGIGVTFVMPTSMRRKGLNRHIKDKHLPWNFCPLCSNFQWPKGRRYSFEKHLRSRHKDDLGYPRGVCNPRRTT
jgi:hypothetical protein